jgi:hypothetical protein
MILIEIHTGDYGERMCRNISGWVWLRCAGHFHQGIKDFFFQGKYESAPIEMIEVITDLPSKQTSMIH